MTKQILNGEKNTIKGGQTMEQILQDLNMPSFSEVMAKYITDPVFKDLPFADKKAMAEVEFNAIIEVAKATIAAMATGAGTTVEDEQVETKVEEKKTEEKKQDITTSEKSEKDEMDKLLGMLYVEMTKRGAVASKVASTIIYKFITQYGGDIDKVARYVAAFMNYFVTDKGEESLRRLGKDILALVGIQLGKNLLGEFDALIDLLEFGESVVKIKTGIDATRAVFGAHRYAKKNQENITRELIDFGNKQKLTSMAYAAIDELMDQE